MNNILLLLANITSIAKELYTKVTLKKEETIRQENIIAKEIIQNQGLDKRALTAENKVAARKRVNKYRGQ